jgi:hypothetical protein
MRELDPSNLADFFARKLAEDAPMRRCACRSQARQPVEELRPRRKESRAQFSSRHLRGEMT